MGKSMKIYVSSVDEGIAPFQRYKGQKIGFINVLNGAHNAINDKDVNLPVEVPYSTENIEDVAACLLNYEDYEGDNRRYTEEQGFSPMRSGNTTSVSSVFRQEIKAVQNDDGTTSYEPLTRMYPVDAQVTNFKFRDFNVSNNRIYRYILYPFDKATDEVVLSLQKSVYEPIITGWSGWSITELHPVQNMSKKFTATADDVWVFNLNISTGEQTQNISRNEQQTLGQFNRYSQGKTNYISGTVSCLLGSDVLPASYILKNGRIINNGGYQEIRKTNTSPSSNERIDMLLAWRRVVMSANPKLLKDRAGQSFLVTLTSASNTPMDAVRQQPNTISFTWTQIGNTEDVEIVDTSL